MGRESVCLFSTAAHAPSENIPNKAGVIYGGEESQGQRYSQASHIRGRGGVTFLFSNF